MENTEIISMIDEYIMEPNNIDRRWEAALLQIREILLKDMLSNNC